MPTQKFSIVTPNRNRIATLRQVIASWQSCRHVSEIVVVDLGSIEPITLEQLGSPEKIHIVRVTNSDSWRIGLAINIGVDQASSDHIFKLDSDMFIRDGEFLDRLDLQTSFYRGRAGTDISNGQTCFSRQAWSRIGGYNEWLSGYGYDDSDFYQRLRLSGLAERPLAAGAISELHTGLEARAATEFANEMFSVTFSDPSSRLAYMTGRNTYLAMMHHWSPRMRVQYAARKTSEGTTVIELNAMHGDYRWADALTNFLAFVRISGTPQNVDLLNSLVLRYLGSVGGL